VFDADLAFDAYSSLKKTEGGEMVFWTT